MSGCDCRMDEDKVIGMVVRRLGPVMDTRTGGHGVRKMGGPRRNDLRTCTVIKNSLPVSF